jgi:hypothetical protein
VFFLLIFSADKVQRWVTTPGVHVTAREHVFVRGISLLPVPNFILLSYYAPSHCGYCIAMAAGLKLP